MSFAYSFDHPDAPTNKRVQYFETSGDRAIWADGWKAVVRHRAGDDFENDEWELFHVENDFCELTNLANSEPERLQSLIDLWLEEAKRYDVLPMSDDLLGMYKSIVPKPRARHVFYPGMTRLDRLSAPDIYQFSSTMVVELELAGSRSSGVLLASGDGSIGYEWYLKKGYIHFAYVYTRERVTTWRSEKRVRAGKRLLGLNIQKIGDASARVSARVDGMDFGSFDLPQMWPIYAPNSGIRCGENQGAPISGDYEGSFAFEGDLKRVIVDVDV